MDLRAFDALLDEGSPKALRPLDDPPAPEPLRRFGQDVQHNVDFGRLGRANFKAQRGSQTDISPAVVRQDATCETPSGRDRVVMPPTQQ